MSAYNESLQLTSPRLGKRLASSPVRQRRNLMISTPQPMTVKKKAISKAPSKQALLDSLQQATDQAAQFQEIAEDAQREADLRVQGYENLLHKERDKTAQIAQQCKDKQHEAELRVYEMELKQQTLAAERDNFKLQLERSTQEARQANSEITTLKQQIQQMQANLSSADQQLSELKKIQATAAEYKADNEKLSKMLEKCQGQLIENDKRIAQLQEDNELKDKDGKAKQKQIEAMNAAVHQAKNKLVAKNEELQQRQLAVNRLNGQFEKAKKMLYERTEMVKSARTQKTGLEQKAHALESQLAQSQKAAEELQQQFDQQRQTLQAKFQQQIRAQMARGQEAQQEMLDEQNRAREQDQVQIASLKKDREEARREADEATSSYQMLQLQMNQKQAEIQVLQTHLDELRIKNSAKDKILDDTQQRLDKINQKLVFSVDQNEYRAQINQLKSANEELRAKLRSVISENDNNQLSSSTSAVQAMKQLSARNAELQEENLKVKMQLQDLQTKVQRGEREDQRWKNEFETLQAQERQAQSQLQQAQEAIRQLKSELSQALDQAQQCQSGFVEMQAAMLKNDHDGSIRIMVQQYKDEADSLYGQLSLAKEEVTKARSSLRQAKAASEQQQQNIETMKQRIESLGYEIKQMTTAAQARTTELLDYQQQVNLLNDFKQKHTDCDLVRNERDELRMRTQALETENQNLLAQVNLRATQNGDQRQVAFTVDQLAVSQLSATGAGFQQNMMQTNQQLQQSGSQAAAAEAKGIESRQGQCQSVCQHAQQNQILQELLKDTQDKYYALQQQQAKAQLENEPEEKSVETLRAAQADFAQQIEQNRALYSGQITRLNDQIATLMQENQELKAQRPLIENDLEQSKYLNQNYENELALKTKIQQQLQAENGELSENYQREQYQNQKILAMNKKLQQELQEALDKLDADNQVVETFKQKLSQLGQVQSLCAEQKLQIQRLQYECDSYKEEIEQLQRKATRQQEVVEQVREKDMQIRQLQAEYDNCKMDLIAAKQTGDQLKMDTQRLQDRVQQQSSDILARQQEVSDLQAQLLEMTDLKVQVKQLDSANQQIKALNSKLTTLELENLTLTKKLNETSDEKLKLQSSNIMLINLHREQIQNSLQLNFKLDKDNINALISILDSQKNWNLQEQDVLILCDRKFISNKNLQHKVVQYLNAKRDNDLASSFFGNDAFFDVGELINYSDSLKLALKRYGVDSCQKMLRRCVQVFNVVRILQNHLFVVQQLAELVQLPCDFSKETSLTKQNYQLVLRDSKNSNLLSSCHISDFIFLQEYRNAVFQKIRCNWKKCEGKIYQIVKEGIDLARLEADFDLGTPIALERFGLLREKRLFENENMGEAIDFNVYYACVCWLLLMQGCEISRVETCSGYDKALGENDDQLYELYYPAVLKDGEVVGRGLGRVIR